MRSQAYALARCCCSMQVADSGKDVSALRVDGGVSTSDQVIQLMLRTSAWGAA